MILELNAPHKLFHPDNSDHLRCQNNFADMTEFKNMRKKMNIAELNNLERHSNVKMAYDAFKALTFRYNELTLIPAM